MTPDVARGVSKAYNISGAARIWLTEFSSESFAKQGDKMQADKLTAFVDILSGEIDDIKNMISSLNHLAEQCFCSFVSENLFGCK